MCRCQVYGKNGVPNAEGKCLICGMQVDPDGNPLAELIAGLLANGEIELKADLCGKCGTLVGIGDPSLHIGICEKCSEAARIVARSN